MNILSETHGTFQNLSSNNYHFSRMKSMCLAILNRYLHRTSMLFTNVSIAETIEYILEGFLVTMNIEKALDSLDHNFSISALEKI